MGDPEMLQRLNKKGSAPVTKEEAERKSSELGAMHHMECSALTQAGLKTVFDEAIRCAMNIEKNGKGKPGKKNKQAFTKLFFSIIAVSLKKKLETNIKIIQKKYKINTNNKRKTTRNIYIRMDDLKMVIPFMDILYFLIN